MCATAATPPSRFYRATRRNRSRSSRRCTSRSTRSKVVLAGGLAVASFIGVARVMAGYHFITDVVGGAVVGSSLGVLIGSVHPSPVHVVPVVNDSPAGRQAGIGIQGSF